MDADEGLNVKDESITITNDITGSFSTDNIDPANVAMWFGGDIDKSTIVAATAVVEPDFVATRGRSYQLGKTADTPQGTRKVTNVTIATITPGALPADPPVVTPIATLDGNVDIDLDRARVYIESDAPDIADGDVLRVTYDQEGVTRQVIIAKGQEVRGALRFLATNPVGERKDYFWPYVKITANGDYALKGDDWQVMSFNYEVLKLDANTERVYIETIPAATV
jgi:predicted RNA-binding protein